MPTQEDYAHMFEGEELEPSYDRSRRSHSSRSTFERHFTFKLLSSVTSSAAVTSVLASAGVDDFVRLKRVQAKILVPKGTSAGWVGFLREPAGMDLNKSALDAADAAVLRPLIYMQNGDHATYWDVYLPAVNLSTGGNLHLIARSLSGSTSMVAGIRMVQERGIS